MELHERTPHRRRNPLTGGWIVVSPNRTDRPWQGREESPTPERRPRYDPDCYLCPGNERANGAHNPEYDDTFVFTNDFAALRPDVERLPPPSHHLLRARTVRGTCRVLCFSPRHDLTMARMAADSIRGVVDLWADQVAELGRDHAWVQVFENRGEAMGASNPHPHGQLWALDDVPGEPAAEDAMQRSHLTEHGIGLLPAYVELESGGPRVVVEGEEWLVVVPWWATWPFEALVVPRRPATRLPDLDDAQRDGLARDLRELLVRYDNLFNHPFPYSMGWHQAPGTAAAPHWTLHAHLYPPLLRSATVRKFMVGFEMLAEPQRDLTAEDAAERLRAVPAVHHTADRSAQAEPV